MEKAFYLVTTAHLANRLWFKDEDDFKVGMNYVAVLASSLYVDIMAFVLMSNHVHFVLYSEKGQAGAFINQFKRKYAQFFSWKYQSKELLRSNGVDIQEIFIGDESFERSVAYVQMNPVGANICIDPSGYPWGTGALFFREEPLYGKRVEELSGKALKRLLHSHCSLPGDYRIDQRGFVSPASYVRIAFVESVFRSAKRMNYFLKSSSKAKRLSEAPSFNDQLIVAGIQSLCISLFQNGSFMELTPPQQSEVLKQIRYRFSADPNQIARVSGLSYDEVCQRLEDC